jgi:hypothetical protein
MKFRHAAALKCILITAKKLLLALVLLPGLFRRYKYRHVAQENEIRELVKQDQIRDTPILKSGHWTRD